MATLYMIRCMAEEGGGYTITAMSDSIVTEFATYEDFPASQIPSDHRPLLNMVEVPGWSVTRMIVDCHWAVVWLHAVVGERCGAGRRIRVEVQQLSVPRPPLTAKKKRSRLYHCHWDLHDAKLARQLVALGYRGSRGVRVLLTSNTSLPGLTLLNLRVLYWRREREREGRRSLQTHFWTKTSMN